MAIQVQLLGATEAMQDAAHWEIPLTSAATGGCQALLTKSYGGAEQENETG